MKIKKYKERREEEKYKIKKQIIKEILCDKYNKNCFDCNKGNPENISLFNGIFICNECAKDIHSKLNKNISLLIDKDLNKLSLKGIMYLYHGGNKKLYDFVNYEYPVLKSINKKKFYLTKAMHYYRQWLRYLVNGGNKPLKPLYEECCKIEIRNNVINNEKKEKIKNAILNIELNNHNFSYNNYFNKIEIPLNKNKKKSVINFYNDSTNKTDKIFLYKDNNHFNLQEKNKNDIRAINKNNSNYNKTHSVFDRLNYSNHEYNQIYSKPNLITPTFLHKNSISFTKKKNNINKINEFNIHNSIIFPNKNNNYILFNNNTFDNSLMNTFFVNSKISRNNLIIPKKPNVNKNLHHTFLSSFKLMNNSNNSEVVNKSSVIFKKKNLKNSFSISSKNKKKNRSIFKQESIESNRFQIIPKINLEIKKRKPIIINLKEKQKNNDEDNYFTFYTLTNIRKKEKDTGKININKNNKVEKINKNKDINKLLNLIIEMKKKHKIKLNSKLNNNINKHYFHEQNDKENKNKEEKENNQNINDKYNKTDKINIVGNINIFHYIK